MSEGDMNDPNKIDDADLSRAYEATARDEPPAAMDDAILAKARHAVLADSKNEIRMDESSAAQKKRGAPSGSRHWYQQFAIAATLVVTATLVVLMEKEQPQIGVLAPPASDTAVAPTAKSSTDAVEARDAAPPVIARMETKPSASVRSERPERDRPAERLSRESEQPREQISRVPEQPASPAAQIADAMRAETRAPERQAFPGARVAAAEDAGAPVTASPPAAPARSAALARGDSSLQTARPAPPAATGSGSGSALAERREMQSAEAVERGPGNAFTAKKDESPAVWLARIAELRKQGRIKEAEENLAEFRKRYPQYSIPAAAIEYQK
jgi:hypothetical protein